MCLLCCGTLPMMRFTISGIDTRFHHQGVGHSTSLSKQWEETHLPFIGPKIVDENIIYNAHHWEVLEKHLSEMRWIIWKSAIFTSTSVLKETLGQERPQQTPNSPALHTNLHVILNTETQLYVKEFITFEIICIKRGKIGRGYILQFEN